MGKTNLPLKVDTSATQKAHDMERIEHWIQTN